MSKSRMETNIFFNLYKNYNIIILSIIIYDILLKMKVIEVISHLHVFAFILFVSNIIPCIKFFCLSIYANHLQFKTSRTNKHYNNSPNSAKSLYNYWNDKKELILGSPFCLKDDNV